MEMVTCYEEIIFINISLILTFFQFLINTKVKIFHLYDMKGYTVSIVKMLDSTLISNDVTWAIIYDVLVL